MMTGLDTGRIFPLVIRLIVPAVIAKLITFLYNIVDRMYVSRMQGSGMDALAALGIVLPITLIIQAFADLVGLGGSPRAGIRLGEGNEKEANRLFNLSFLMLVLSGCVIGIITFFFAEPDCTAVWMSAECTWLCHVLSEDLFLRNGIYHAGTGNESFCADAGLLLSFHVFCVNGNSA